MDDLALRLAVAVGVAVTAVAVARLTRGKQRPGHPRVDLSGTGLPFGAVVFTSSECQNCAAVRASLQGSAVPFREVTWELEPRLFEEIGVRSVPLIVVRDNEGAWFAQISGRPTRRELRSLAPGTDGPTVNDP